MVQLPQRLPVKTGHADAVHGRRARLRLDRARHAVVRVLAADDDGRGGAHPAPPGVGQRRLPRREQARERRLRAAGGERAAGRRAALLQDYQRRFG